MHIARAGIGIGVTAAFATAGYAIGSTQVEHGRSTGDAVGRAVAATAIPTALIGGAAAIGFMEIPRAGLAFAAAGVAALGLGAITGAVAHGK